MQLITCYLHVILLLRYPSQQHRIPFSSRKKKRASPEQHKGSAASIFPEDALRPSLPVSMATLPRLKNWLTFPSIGAVGSSNTVCRQMRFLFFFFLHGRKQDSAETFLDNCHN
ncbi:hypothetical protein CDAR_485671 [Caerostris darwini]|uniref:Uncharacterized protein n=1 Tax=Caerostris darwini TaxID=1538125 RepID=A0AAV4WIH2_9ARAC|nr:hypothetical protein CDAR_485671 [Caerostris darwini]